MAEKHGLYLADGSFQPFDTERLTTELATRQNAGDFWGFIDNALGILPDPDPILRKLGNDSQILEDLSADDQVTMAMINRKNRVLNQQGYAFSAGAAGKDEADPKARRLYEELIRDQESWNMQDVLSGVLDAPFFGYVPLELMWRFEGGWWHLVDVLAKPQEWFGFNAENALVWRGANMLTAEPITPGKIVLSRHYPTFKNPYGMRLLSRCLWPVAFKKGGIQFYVNFVEKYGMPWAIGTAPAKAKREEKREMAADLARMVQDAVAVIPAGSSVNLVTASGQVGDLHERFLKRWDASISKVLMGQTLTAELSGTGTYAASNTHMEVAQDIADSDKRMVEQVMNEIGWLYGQLNDKTAMCPIFAYEEKKDRKAQAELDEKLYSLGVRFTPAHYEQEYDLDPDEFTDSRNQIEMDEKLYNLGVRFNADHFQKVYGLDPKEFEVAEPYQSPQNPFLSLGADFASPKQEEPPLAPSAPSAISHRDVLENAITKAMPEANKAAGKMIDEIVETLDKAETWEDAQLLLAEALSDLSANGLEEVLTNMMLGAASYGQAAIKTEQKKGG